jgi:hypothetical protein
MFFRELTELETMMHGHGLAFLQLGFVSDRSATFNVSLAKWLRATRNISTQAGWALAIEELAGRTRVDAQALFFELLEKFIDSWMQFDEDSTGFPNQVP